MRPIFLAVLAACASLPSVPHGHDHGPDGGHHHGSDHGESVAITRWTDTHELFVELDAPVAGASFAYHAHVTRMADNHAATEGTWTIRFEREGTAASTHTDEAVARAGIFAAQAKAPPEPGPYRLMFTYAHGDERAEWSADVEVGDHHPVAPDDAPEGEIAFLKEAQWQIPFRVAPARTHDLVPTIEAAASVAPAPDTTRFVAAPVDGLFVWADEPPAVGRRVDRGETLATLVPTGSTEHWGRLEADHAAARIDLDLATRDVARLEDLHARELVPTRRLDEARAAAGRAATEIDAARRRLAALTSGTSGAVAIDAPMTGWIVHLGAKHGERVQAGSPLVTIATGQRVLIEGHTHDRTYDALAPASSLSVHRGDWDAPVDLLARGGRLITERLIFDPHTLTAPVTVAVDDDLGLQPGDLVTLVVGVGAPSPRLAVPRDAIVEVNSQLGVFVQVSGESFTRRRVVTGVETAELVEIVEGLAPDEMVVTRGGFDVHVAALSGSLESHRH